MNDDTLRLREWVRGDGVNEHGQQVTDDGGFWQEWYCDVPPEGVAFQVIRCAWADDYTVRRIFAVKLADAAH